MKKITCFALALLLCLCSAAVALATGSPSIGGPSKTIGDLVGCKVEGENIPADSGFALTPAASTDEESVAFYNEEYAKLQASESAEAYFGDEIKTSDGTTTTLRDLLGVDANAGLSVDEFTSIEAVNYEESYGEVTATLEFPTTYEEGEKVVVMVGIRNVEGTVVWTAFVGEGQADGTIKTTFDPATVKAIQENKALLAIVSVDATK